MKNNKKERRPNKSNSMKENKKHPYRISRRSNIQKIHNEVRKDIEDAKMDYYLVQENSFFDDDVEVKCSVCGKKCYSRPYYPRNAKIICTKCLADGNYEK